MKKIIGLLFSLLVPFASLFAQFSGNDSIPIRINYLDGERVNNQNQLDWKVSCSLPFARFEIQRSADAVNYSTIHSFQADELRCRQPFSYTDLPPAVNAFYRIKVGDIDGRYYSSKTIALYGQGGGFDLISITPTITSSTTTLTIAASSPGKVEIIIFNAAGLVVKQIFHSVLKGNNAVSIDLAGLSKGTYLVTVSNSNGIVKSGRVIVN